MKMKIVIILIILSLTSITLFAQERGKLEGRIIDMDTKQPLAGSNILIVGTTIGAAADKNGFYEISGIPIGIYNIKASMMGFNTEIKSKIRITTNRSKMVNFELNEKAVDMKGEIVISGGYFDKDSDKPVSVISLSPEEVNSGAGTGRDIFRMVQTLPGVNSIGSKSANLIVRGGAPDENRTMIDNIEIFSPLHFARQGTSMGVISIINPALLSSADFITGGFPSKYGDKMSSVFELKMKDGNLKQFNYDAEASFGGFGLLVDGPVSENSSMVFSARRGIFDLVTQMLNKPVSPNYWDVFSKYTINLDNKNKLSILGFYYLDDFEKDGLDEEHKQGLMKYDYVKRDDFGGAAGVNWRYLFSDKGYMLTTAALSLNGWNTGTGTKEMPSLNGDKIFEREYYLKSEINYKFFNTIDIQFGIFSKAINSDYSIWNSFDTTNTGHIFNTFTKEYSPDVTYKFGSNIQASIKPFNRIIFNAGLRYDYFDFTKEGNVSPRLSMSYNLSERTTLNFAYGHFYQTPETYKIALDSQNEGLKSARSIHYIAGIEHLLRNDLKVSVEAFYKDYDNTFTYSDTSRIIANNGSGFSGGVELFVQKKMTDRLVGSFSYTYSTSQRKDYDNLSLYEYDYDAPHNFILSAGYKLSDDWQIGCKFQYTSGSPYTPAIGTQMINSKYYVIEGEKNSQRLPDFHKLDLRIDKKFFFSNWTLDVFVDIWNIYNRENITRYFVYADKNGNVLLEPNTDFSIMPFLGIIAEF